MDKEDEIVIWNLKENPKPTRNIFQIDVPALPPEQAEEFLERLRCKFKNKEK